MSDNRNWRQKIWGVKALARSIACSLFIALLSACGGDRVAEPEPKRNSQPKSSWQIELSSSQKGLVVRPRVLYAIDNADCIPLDHTRALGGVRPDFLKRVYPPLLKGTGYAYVAYDDYFIDANHYGLGICDWRISSTDFEITYEGVTYVTGIGRDQVLTESTEELACDPLLPEKRQGSCLLAGPPWNRSGTLNIKITSRSIAP